MPRIEFWFSETDAIAWTFDRVPEVEERVVLGDSGVYRITGRRPNREGPGVDVALACERVRDATLGEIREQARDVQTLRNALIDPGS